MTSTAAEVVEALRAAGLRVATAESLTGGLLCATLVDVPGASDVVVGGIVAYDPQVKIDQLGVDATVIAEHGTVHPTTAARMAEGALARVSGAAVAVATTGVAGPDPSEGRPVGTVHVAVADARGTSVHDFAFTGDRPAVRRQAVDAALSALAARLGED